jgi:membrane protein YdbS with pleckstrin-like domain
MVESSAQPTAEVRRTAESDLANARAALSRRDFDAAIPLFRRLRNTAYQAEGDYGLGWVAKEQGRLDDADRYFRRAIEFDGTHAHSYWQLGKLALRRNSPEQARSWFLTTLEVQPGHKAAIEELATLGGPSGSARARQEAGPVDEWQFGGSIGGAFAEGDMASVAGPASEAWGIEPSSFGVYEYLRRDRSHLSRQAVAALDRMHVERYPPTYLSFFGFGLPSPASTGKLLQYGLVALIGIVVLGAIGTFLVLLLTAPPSAPTPRTTDTFAVLRQALPGMARFVGNIAFWAYVAVVAAVLFKFLRHITTRIRIEHGRLQVERGLLTRTRTNLELWRVQNIVLERKGLHLLTGDGDLVFHGISGTDPITVTGLARGRELDRLHQELLDLVFLLRTNPSIKGIVQ